MVPNYPNVLVLTHGIDCQKEKHRELKNVLDCAQRSHQSPANYGLWWSPKTLNSERKGHGIFVVGVKPKGPMRVVYWMN